MRGHQRGRTSLGLLSLLLFAAFAIYYVIANRSTVPVTGRTQVVGTSEAEEAALGVHAYREVLRGSRVVTSGPQAEAVRRVGRRLAAVSDDPGFEWEFNLIESPQANAFCLPGGKVAVFTGILPMTADEDGLAAVMGHEIAHAVARHGAERMAHETLARLGQAAVVGAVGDMDPGRQRLVLGAFGAGATFGVLLPFSRKHESEADRIGLTYAARACFDPRAAPRFWERMASLSRRGASPPEFASTHPSDETRIAALTALMPAAIEEKRAKCGA